MGKRLIVAEKPSVGRDIANALNCYEQHKGYISGKNDIVTWAVGHLVGLAMPEDINPALKDWKIEDLPIIPDEFQLKVLSSGEDQFEVIRKLMLDPEIDNIVCATDAGREGELIFRYIYQKVGCTKPVERLWISSLTYGAIKDGFANLKPASEYDHLYESAKCRSQADWLIGMNGTRVFAVVNEVKKLSVGRVMSPTLAILVQREMERRDFVPEKYCEVLADFGGFYGKMLNPEKEEDNQTFFPVDRKEELTKYEEHHSAAGSVINIENDEKAQPSKMLYDLTSLQRDANRIYGMSSQWTLDTAQKLYEQKAITYPRTDSRYLTSDIKPTFPKILESLKKGALKPFVEKALVSEKDLYGRFINNKEVTDHHAIIPTGVAKDMDSWPNAEKIIFDLIARRFIGMFLSDRVTVQQNAIIQVDRSDFTCTGEKLIEAGWSEVDKNIGNMKSNLPELHTGDSVAISKMWVRTDETTPPAPHTEASLLLAMEHAGSYTGEEDDDDVEMEFGIGTPATRAQTIEKLIEKEMAVHKGKALIPTEYGIKLVSILPDVLRSPELTGKWEAKLTQIAKGKESPDEFMADIKNLTTEVVDFSITQGKTNLEEAKYVGKCPVCGNWVKEFPTAYYCITPGCDFKKIFKAVKGFHPTLDSLTMHELLANGTAETGKGVFSIIEEPPFIAFKKAPDTIPDYKFLKELIEYYGLHYVNNVCKGGALWIAGDQDDELMQDFVKECKAAGCIFIFKSDSKALKGKPGWYLSVKPEHKNTFCMYFH